MLSDTSFYSGSPMVSIGMTADEILRTLGYNPYLIKKIGDDENGLIVQWCFFRFNLTLKRSSVDGMEAYRVTEIEAKGHRDRTKTAIL